MKRSEINRLIINAKNFLSAMTFKLPPWAYWKAGDWKGKADQVKEIVEAMMGWDLTDFGGNDFYKKGLILFTIRNGVVGKSAKSYAEKIMIVDEEQETPMHFHWNKMEDIINRGGGNLVMELYGATEQEGLSEQPLSVGVDGIVRVVEPGGKVVLRPGESICLAPRVYHRFYGESGNGKVLVGEVSSVNDDTTDNRFFDPQGRFPEIEEDETPEHLLVTDYRNYL